MRGFRWAGIAGFLAVAMGPLGAQEATPVAVPDRAFGVYDVGEGDRVFVVAEEGHPLIGFSDGQVRGLAQDGDGYRYGPSIGVDQPAEGRIAFDLSTDVPSVIWLPAAGPRRGGTRLPVRTEEVPFDSDGVRLAATLFLPATPPPWPAVVLVHGSGPQTRGPGFYEYLFSSLGIATLSYDKRGAGESGGKGWRVPFEVLARDVLAGVRMLRLRPDIDGTRIGLHGSSQGGWIAPLAASLSEPGEVAFVIVRSGNAVSPRRQNLYAVEQRFRDKTDLDDATIADALRYIDLRMDHVITGKRGREFRAARKAKAESAWGRYVGNDLPNVEFWRPNGNHDPLPALRGLRCPILVLLGDCDKSTSAKDNAPVFERVLSGAGHPDYTVRVFEHANHGMFETHTAASLEEEWPRLKRLVPGYVDTMTAWLRTRVLELP